MGLFQKIISIHKSKLRPRQQLRFLERLYILLNKGYSLISALTMMSYDKEMNDSAQLIKNCLIKGLTIDESFEKANFDSTIISYLYFIRMNGDLQSSLNKCIAMFKQRVTNFEKFLRIIRYPLILTIIFIILLTVIKKIILPTFLDLFESTDGASSTVIYFILLIDFISSLFIVIFILSILSIIVWKMIKKRVSIETQLQIYKYIPFFRAFLTIQTTFQFATHMSMLLKTGMPIKQVLNQMANQNKLPIVSYYSTLMIQQLENGIHYISLLQQLSFIEKQFANLFQKNSDQHQLEKDLSTYAHILADKIEQKTMKIIAIIQPTFFIVIGCFIIVIYGALMWPLLQLVKTV